MKFLIILVLLLVLAVAVAMMLRPSGPRITRIEHRREDEDREDKE